MVRVGGVSYAINPRKPMGERISDLRIAGKPLEMGRGYKAAGWASMTETAGGPIHDVVTDHLRREKVVRLDGRSRVRVIG